jgi:1-acyl-sn-glycerol-3-phosphate acyltransferase
MWPLVMMALLAVGSGLWLRARGTTWSRLLDLGAPYAYARLWHRWSSNGLAPLPTEGPAIVIANHTSSADPAFLVAGCSRRLRFLVAKEYYKIRLLNALFNRQGYVPVTRNGQDAGAAREALRCLQAGNVVCLFPEGGLSNAGRPRVRRGKGGAAWLALKSQAPVFPALIVGGPQTNSIRRSWLGCSRVRVIFGRAVDLTPYLDRPINPQLVSEVTRLLMASIEKLAGNETAGAGVKTEDSHEQRNRQGTDPKALRSVRGRSACPDQRAGTHLSR